MEPITKVVFRVWKDANGGVIALFPYEDYNLEAGICMSYEHVGQHCGADYTHVMKSTRPAKPEESKALRKELERIGYKLKAITRKVRG